MAQTPVAISGVLTENVSSFRRCPSLCTRYVPGELITNKATLTKLLLNPKAWWTKTEVRPGSSPNSENQNHFVNKDVTSTDSWPLFNKILIETELALTTDTLIWSDRLHVVLPKGGSYKQNEFVLQRFT